MSKYIDSTGLSRVAQKADARFLKQASVAAQFSVANNYASGDTCMYDGVLYVFTMEHMAGAWDASHVVAVNIGKSITDLMENAARIDGAYDGMSVGNANQLISSVGIKDKVPYNFRASGGSVDIGDRETDIIVGGTIVYNELLYAQNKTESDIRNTGVDAIFSDRKITMNGTASDWGFINIRYASTRFFFPAGHVFYINGLNGKVALEIESNGSPASLVAPFYNDKVVKIPNYTGAKASWIRITFYKDYVFDNDTIEPNVFDLTKMFGSSIADYVYSLEQTTAGAGVAWVKKLFPNTVYPYNEGELWSVKTSAHIMTGFNQWDEQWELGGLIYSTGEPSSANDRIRSKNFCRCLPNTVYYAKAPSPYLTIWWYDSAQRFLGYESAQNIAGTLTVTSPATAMYFKLVLAGNATTYGNDICINCSRDGERNGEYEPYIQHVYELDPNLELRGIARLDQNNKLYYDGDTYESDGTVTRHYGIREYQSGDESDSTVLTDGTNTLFKLESESVDTANPYQNPQIVDDFGTEEYVDTRALQIPVGHETFYQTNLKSKLESSPNSPDSDGDYIMRRINGANTYVPFADVKEVPNAPADDGTYTLKVVVINGTATLAWE